MSISEQVKELREIAKNWNPNTPINPVSVVLNKAADTIESLSAKLADMERSAEDCGGWIPCKERLPEDEGMYLITAKVLEKIEIQYVFFQKNMDLFICNGIAIAWQPLPEPYHEPQQIHHPRQRTPQAIE